LRGILASTITIEQVVDFGHAPIFPDADAFPCIVVLRKTLPAKDHAVKVTRYPREQLGQEHLASYIESHCFELPQNKLGKAGWTLEHPRALTLLEKLRERGVPLSEYTGVKPYRGVLTGFNDAFLVDQATKERLCREDPRSAEILKKYLRGQDIARWSPKWDSKWMIFARRGVDIELYPAIKAHLEGFRTQLEPRPDSFVRENWPGRKPGSYKWYEIQDSVDYYPLFDKPKLIWKDISFHPAFSLDPFGYFTNDLCFIFPKPDLWLLAALNAPAMWAWLSRNTMHGKDEVLRLKSVYMSHAPIPQPNAEQADQAANAVQRIVDLTRSVTDSVAATLDVLRVEWAVDCPGEALGAFDALEGDAFVGEVKKRRRKEAGRLSPRALVALRKLFEAETPQLIAMRAEILVIERMLAGLVHAAWGLNAEDLAVLRETAPPRMPPGW
jgi:hypothetical protein